MRVAIYLLCLNYLVGATTAQDCSCDKDVIQASSMYSNRLEDLNFDPLLKDINPNIPLDVQQLEQERSPHPAILIPSSDGSTWIEHQKELPHAEVSKSCCTAVSPTQMGHLTGHSMKETLMDSPCMMKHTDPSPGYNLSSDLLHNRHSDTSVVKTIPSNMPIQSHSEECVPVPLPSLTPFNPNVKGSSWKQIPGSALPTDADPVLFQKLSPSKGNSLETIQYSNKPSGKNNNRDTTSPTLSTSCNLAKGQAPLKCVNLLRRTSCSSAQDPKLITPIYSNGNADSCPSKVYHIPTLLSVPPHNASSRAYNQTCANCPTPTVGQVVSASIHHQIGLLSNATSSIKDFFISPSLNTTQNKPYFSRKYSSPYKTPSQSLAGIGKAQLLNECSRLKDQHTTNMKLVEDLIGVTNLIQSLYKNQLVPLLDRDDSKVEASQLSLISSTLTDMDRISSRRRQLELEHLKKCQQVQEDLQFEKETHCKYLFKKELEEQRRQLSALLRQKCQLQQELESKRKNLAYDHKWKSKYNLTGLSSQGIQQQSDAQNRQQVQESIMDKLTHLQNIATQIDDSMSSTKAKLLFDIERAKQDALMRVNSSDTPPPYLPVSSSSYALPRI